MYSNDCEDFGFERYEDDLQDFSDHEAWYDMRNELENEYDEGGSDYDFEELHQPEDDYLDGSYEDRYYAPEADFDWH